MTDTATRAARLAAVASRSRPGLLARLRRAWELRRAERQLRELDERMLRDMGLTRGDVERVVRGGR